jgi:hypothetical protein
MFIDAVHPMQETTVHLAGSKKGIDKLIETTKGRTRLNIVGAI